VVQVERNFEGKEKLWTPHKLKETESDREIYKSEGRKISGHQRVITVCNANCKGFTEHFC
jgi:hypothetical protein